MIKTFGGLLCRKSADSFPSYQDLEVIRDSVGNCSFKYLCLSDVSPPQPCCPTNPEICEIKESTEGNMCNYANKGKRHTGLS